MDNQAPTPSFADIEAMKYNDLKSKAAELSLDASGTKEDLIGRITEKLGLVKEPAAPTAPVTTEAPAAPAASAPVEPEAPAPAAPAAEVAAPAPKPAPQEKPAPAAPAPSVEQLHVSKAMRTKAALDKQPKVMVLIPFDAGEKPEQAKTIPFHVGINGYSIDIPRGVMIEVPQQVARMVRERLESEGRMGREHRVDADPARQAALS